MSFAACDDILRPGKYRNYDQRVDSGERDPAEEQNHASREMVGERIYPAYSQHICYAALSPDGHGLTSYGPVAVRWRVTPMYLGRRASLLDENSYTFYEQNGLGTLTATVPSGHRAVWEDRALLVAAKLADRLTPATSETSLPDLLFHAGAARPQDEIVEIAIYAGGGLDTEDVDMVTRETPPTTAVEWHRWQIIRDVCSGRPIDVVE